MILVDTSIWIDYFKGIESALPLMNLIDSNSICTNDLVLAELLPSLKVRKESELIRLLESVERYSIRIDWNEIINMPKNKNKRESEISFKSANLELAILHHFFAWCKDRGICGDNPADGVKKLKELRREIYISPEEQERLINCAAPHLKAFIKFSALTGLRTGDALNLKWQYIDIEHGVMRVFVAKTRQQKVMPLSDIAGETLKTIDKNGDYVFSYNGGRLASVKKSFATAVKKAGLAGRKGLTPHALRHIFVTRMSESGIDDATIRSATLHMSSEMSSRYRHLSPGALKNALNKAFGKPD
jgi:integrase